MTIATAMASTNAHAYVFIIPIASGATRGMPKSAPDALAWMQSLPAGDPPTDTCS